MKKNQILSRNEAANALQITGVLLAGVLPLSAQDSEPSPAGDEAVRLPPVTVAAEREGGYVVEQAPGVTKMNIPIAETPGSIQVVPRQVIEDQAALGLEDVYINVSGVARSGNTLNAQSEVMPVIRGFETPIIFRNGVRATQVGAVDLVNIEQVEVLKGPASILFGALEPGGVLNYTTKTPLAAPFYELNQEFGSYSLFRTTFDATGPIDQERRLRYRLNAAFTDSGSFRNDVDLERWAVAPVLAWSLSDQTDLTLDFSYTHETVPYDSGVPFGFDDEPLVPISTFFGDPTLDGRTLEDIFAGFTLEHRLNEVFTFRNRFQFHRAMPKNESIRHRGVRGTPGAEELRLRYQNEERVDDEYQLVPELLADFNTGSIEHRALAGVDLIHQESDFDRFRQNLPNVPITENPDFRFTPPADNDPAPAFRSDLQWVAIYLQDQMSMLEEGRLKLLLGGRWDYVDQEQWVPAESSSTQSEFTGRAGVLYEVTDWAAPYASLSQSFLPQGLSVVDQGGSVLDPERGVQYEAGIKFELFNDRLLATVAAYEIEKEDVAVFDNELFANTGQIAYFPGVEQQSRGVELDVTGRITDALSVIANYAYTDTEVLENSGDPAMEGDRLGNVPLHLARLWLAYNFAAGSLLEGLGFGTGLRYESERMAQFDDTLTLDEFVVFDAGAWYRHALEGGQTLKAQLNVQNITDEEHYVRASDRSIVHPGAPLRVIGSIGMEF